MKLKNLNNIKKLLDNPKELQKIGSSVIKKSILEIYSRSKTRTGDWSEIIVGYEDAEGGYCDVVYVDGPDGPEGRLDPDSIRNIKAKLNTIFSKKEIESLIVNKIIK